MNIQFESLHPLYDYSSFDCGNEALNQFLVNRAKIEEAQRLSRTKVAFNDTQEIVGFYTLAPATITKSYLDSNEGRGVPYSEIPALRIGRLAVDKKHQGRGIGQIILKHALLRCLKLSNEMGGRLILVDAKDIKAASFYKRLGFKTIKQYPLLLIMKISTVEKAWIES